VCRDAAAAAVDADSSTSSVSSAAAGVNDASGRVRWRKDQTQWRQLSSEVTGRFVTASTGVAILSEYFFFICQSPSI